MNIAVKIFTFIITTGIVGLLSFFLFGFMILAMNGYNEADVEFGIYLYMIWAVLGSGLAGVLGIISAHFLVERKKLHTAAAGAISLTTFIIVGVLINFVGVIAGIATAEIVRTQF